MSSKKRKSKKQKPEECYILEESRDLFFIPADDFIRYFILDEKTNTAYENETIEWHCMSGGLDTYMQGYWFQHARSSIRYGDWKGEPRTILGYYKFSLNSPPDLSTMSS